jgi:DNA-binding transcriptional regulator YiaG
MNKNSNKLDLNLEIDALNTLIDTISKKNNISYSKIFTELKQKQNLKQKESKTIKIPVLIFKSRTLGVLESIVKYLREELKLKYSEIAKLLNRDDRVIWTTYKNSIKKQNKKLTVDKNSLQIDISVFSNNKLGCLESLIINLREENGLKNKEIAKMLNRDSRTISSSYNKAKQKLSKIKKLNI